MSRPSDPLRPVHGLSRVSLAAVTALVVYGLGLWVAQSGGLTWTRPLVSALILPALVVGWRMSRGSAEDSGSSPRRPANPWSTLEWALCLGAFALFALATQLGWNVMSDYVFHWGMKAKRFALTGGIDYEFLALPWQIHLHPDYPNLLPTLYAASFVLVGSLDWWAAAPISILGWGLFLLATRALAHDCIPAPVPRLLAVGTLWAGSLAFAMQPMVAGGADLLIALTLVFGCHGLILPLNPGPERPSSGWRRDLALGCVAAFGAVSKLEGVPVAATLIALYGLRLWLAAGPGPALKSVLRGAALPLLVIGYWLVHVRRHELFVDSNTGGLDWQRLPTVIGGLVEQLVHPVWHGLPLVLLALPVLAWTPRLRLPALLLLVQAGFYVYVYLAGPVDTELWIQTSASRLFFHLIPATALLVIGGLVAEPAQQAPPQQAADGTGTLARDGALQTPVSGNTSSTERAAFESPASSATTERACS